MEGSQFEVSERDEKHYGDQNEPKDSWHIAYMIHFLLGAGYLVPWNSFITAVDYFQYLYPNKHVSKVFSVAYMVASMTVLFILMLWSSSGKGKLPAFRIRMNLGLCLFVLALMTSPVTDWIIDHGRNGGGGGRNRSDVAYVVIVLMVVVTGFAEGLVSGSLIGATGELPGRYMQAVVSGNASSGVLVSTLRIITKASLPHSPKGLQTSTEIYFLTSTFIILICIICCNLQDRLPTIRYYRHKYCSTGENTNDQINELHDPPEEKSKGPKFWEVLKKIRRLVISILIIYIVTLSIFPGYLSENVQSKRFQDWYAILLITTFNVGDFSGKCLTSIYMPKSNKYTTWSCMARLIFYPLFIGCLHGPRWLRSEAPVVILTLMLGISNGYLTGVLMILAPKLVPVEESEIAGIIMSLFLLIGLVTGSALGWLWNI